MTEECRSNRREYGTARKLPIVLLSFVHERFCYSFYRTIEIEGKTVKFDVHEFRVPLPAAEAASVYGQRPPIQKSTENLLGMRLYFRNIAGAMLVYDVTKRSTFEHVEYWRKQVREYAGYHSNVPILLVGTKCDLQNQIEVTMEEACIYAGKNSMSFIETSARNSTNVNTAFENLFKEVHCSKDVDDCSFFGRSRIDISNTRICGII
ncbi:ras-related protein rab-11.1-like isoform X2 [Mercenaria mercenaria]|uniref:ras-related protein rab-11.1-like isoform X2 n=1 Tax=Mercenaria mercenaria TaxID=6596 RepID=UPI00234F7F14|nr:ras-related protein rab-11.1-like isoform X2 [Mercenaria mercenaria]